MEDAPRLLKIPKSECPDLWMRLPNTNGPNHGTILKTPLFLLRETYTDTHLQDSCGKDRSQKSLMELGMVKNDKLTMLFLVHRKQKFFLSVHVDDINMAGRGQHLAPMWKKLTKNVDIEEPTSFLDHVYLGCTQRGCKPNDTIFEEHKKMYESRILLEQQKNYQDGKSLRCPTTWKDMLRNAWNCIANWQIRRQSNYTRFPVLAGTITKLRKKNWKMLVKYHKFAHKLS